MDQRLIEHSRQLTHHHLQEPRFMLHLQEELGTQDAADDERDQEESSGARRFN